MSPKTKRFTREEREAMQDRVRELKAGHAAHGESAVLAKIGFSDTANLDDGAVWPVAFALKELTPAAEAKIVTLVKQAVS